MDEWLRNLERYATGELNLKTFHGFSMRRSALVCLLSGEGESQERGSLVRLHGLVRGAGG